MKFQTLRFNDTTWFKAEDIYNIVGLDLIYDGVPYHTQNGVGYVCMETLSNILKQHPNGILQQTYNELSVLFPYNPEPDAPKEPEYFIKAQRQVINRKTIVNMDASYQESELINELIKLTKQGYSISSIIRKDK